jgi:mannose-6-phosphate isomerase-like protein (cupin superfamily)
MPIIQGPHLTTPADDITSWGLATFTKGQRNVTELHFHDADEYVCMISGRICMRSEGILYDLVARDVLVTRMGDEHELLEVIEDTTYFWFTGPLRGACRSGHLHRPVT